MRKQQGITQSWRQNRRAESVDVEGSNAAFCRAIARTFQTPVALRLAQGQSVQNPIKLRFPGLFKP